MLQGEHSAILSTFIKLPFVIKIFVLSIFERPLKTGFIVFQFCYRAMSSQANKEQFLKQFEQIVEGVEQNKGKVIFQKIWRKRLLKF